MPYERKGKCVYKKGSKKPKGCSDSIEKAKKYLTKLRMVEIEEQIKEFFSKKDSEYLIFENHPQATIEKLLDENEKAPWD